MKLIFKGSIFLLLFIVISCAGRFHSEKIKYYTSEIFNSTNSKIYGTWKLIQITGGFTGKGKALDFETLQISEIGKFNFKNQSGQNVSGKIAVEFQKQDSLFVSFVSDNGPSAPLYSDVQKYIKLFNKDTLYLISPCCDRYDYKLIRKK